MVIYIYQVRFKNTININKIARNNLMESNYKFINNFPKEDVYRVYSGTVLDPRDYDKVTRRQMLEAIYDEMAFHPDLLEYYIDASALNMLLHMSHSPIIIKNLTYNDLQIIEKLSQAYLIYYDKTLRNYIIPDRLKKALELYEPSGNHQALDEFYDFIYGLLLSRGYIGVSEAQDIYYKTKPERMDLDFESTLYNFIRFLVHIDIPLLEIEDLLVYHLAHMPFSNEDYTPVFEYTWEMYVSIGKYGINTQIDVLKRFYEALVKVRNEILAKDIVLMMIGTIRATHSYLEMFIKNILIEALGSVESADKLFDEVLHMMPNWAFKGDPLIVVSDTAIKDYLNNNT